MWGFYLMADLHSLNGPFVWICVTSIMPMSSILVDHPINCCCCCFDVSSRNAKSSRLCCDSKFHSGNTITRTTWLRHVYAFFYLFNIISHKVINANWCFGWSVSANFVCMHNLFDMFNVTFRRSSDVAYLRLFLVQKWFHSKVNAFIMRETRWVGWTNNWFENLVKRKFKISIRYKSFVWSPDSVI